MKPLTILTFIIILLPARQIMVNTSDPVNTAFDIALLVLVTWLAAVQHKKA